MKLLRYPVLALICATLLLSCKKDSSSPQSKFPFYFAGTVNNKAVKYECNDLDSKYGCAFATHGHGPYPEWDWYEGTEMYNQDDPYVSAIYVDILRWFPSYPEYDDRLLTWKLGDYPYGVSRLDSGKATTNGAVVAYYDENGIYWQTETGPQTGSTFKVTELVSNEVGTSLKIFTAKFNCTLYNENGQSMKIQNGVIRGKLYTP